MKVLYDAAFVTFAVFSLPYLVLKGKLHSGYGERFSFLPGTVIEVKGAVWIHAVSVGEAALAVKLARRIKECSAYKVVLSTTTRTGREFLEKVPAGEIDAVFYSPVDLSFVARRFLRMLSPAVYVMIETELWPNMLAELDRAGVPVVLANGRISDGSFANYRKVRFLTRRILGHVDVLCMQSERDADRIRSLGGEASRIRVTGNVKFDEPEPARVVDRAGYIGSGEGPVLVAGSTHFPEERLVLDVFTRLKKCFPGLRLVLAPRHPERARGLGAELSKRSLRWLSLSDVLNGRDVPDGLEVLLVDVIGYLKELYGLADVAYVGGSLTDRGGQNPVEAAVWGLPVLFGSNMSNFKEIADIFVDNGAAFRVRDVDELEECMAMLLRDPEKRSAMARKGREVLAVNRGALARTAQEVLRCAEGARTL